MTRHEQAPAPRNLSSRQLRLAERYSALCGAARTLRSLQDLGDECWVNESPGVHAAADKVMQELEAKADRIADRCPWVRDWEPEVQDDE